MQMTNEQYAKYVKKMSPNSALIKDMLNAFWIGGLICVIGQLVRSGLTALGLDELAVGAGTAVLMVLLGASFMLVVDDASRNLLAVEIPIGILTAFIGAPFFLYLITRKETML